MSCLFPASSTLGHVEDDKKQCHDLACLCCWGHAKSAPFSEWFEPLGKKESYFSKNKGLQCPCVWKNIVFIIPITLDPNLHEC